MDEYDIARIICEFLSQKGCPHGCNYCSSWQQYIKDIRNNILDGVLKV